MTFEKRIPKKLLWPITRGANSAMNQSKSRKIARWNLPKAREKSCTQRAIGFGFEESSDAGLNRKRKRPENRLQEASCPLPLSDFFCLHFSVGYFVEPTIIETKNPEDKIMKEVKFPNLTFLSLQAPTRVYSQVFRHSMKCDPSVFSIREFKKRRRQLHCRKRKNDWFNEEQ